MSKINLKPLNQTCCVCVQIKSNQHRIFDTFFQFHTKYLSIKRLISDLNLISYEVEASHESKMTICTECKDMTVNFYTFQTKVRNKQKTCIVDGRKGSNKKLNPIKQPIEEILNQVPLNKHDIISTFLKNNSVEAIEEADDGSRLTIYCSSPPIANIELVTVKQEQDIDIYESDIDYYEESSDNSDYDDENLSGTETSKTENISLFENKNFKGRSSAYNYFKEIEGVEDRMSCKTCGKTCLVGKSYSTCNILKHLKQKHFELYKEYKSQKGEDVSNLHSPTTRNKDARRSDFDHNNESSDNSDFEDENVSGTETSKVENISLFEDINFKVRSSAYNYFNEIEGVKDRMSCKTCNKTYLVGKSYSTCNILRHLKRTHFELYKEFKSQNGENVSNLTPPSKRIKRSDFDYNNQSSDYSDNDDEKMSEAETSKVENISMFKDLNFKAKSSAYNYFNEIEGVKDRMSCKACKRTFPVGKNYSTCYILRHLRQRHMKLYKEFKSQNRDNPVHTNRVYKKASVGPNANGIFKFFKEIEGQTNRVLCKLCNFNLSSNSKSTLSRHFYRRHPDMSVNVSKKSEQNVQSIQENEDDDELNEIEAKMEVDDDVPVKQQLRRGTPGIYGYFDKVPGRGDAVRCQLCQQIFTSSNQSNLLRHFKRKHYGVVEKIYLQNQISVDEFQVEPNQQSSEIDANECENEENFNSNDD
ncbi:CLUMA_CG016386, isoform A [Clunio marinus]|uniref:CLUMA_CG016386, isoform A n=1 Tax=Clunio marinus TaxID=568069 RepID=A0A1J1ISK3_9DIPT|nr:CLUMA_CG016386, isoform A [Clunio marinus]